MNIGTLLQPSRSCPIRMPGLHQKNGWPKPPEAADVRYHASMEAMPRCRANGLKRGSCQRDRKDLFLTRLMVRPTLVRIGGGGGVVATVGLIFGWAPQEILRPLCRIMLRIAAQEPRKIKAAALLRVYWGERAPDFEVISRAKDHWAVRFMPLI
jgi:hypothetical protein